MLMFKLQTASLLKDGHVIDFENEFIKQLDLKYSSNSKLLQMLNIFIEAWDSWKECSSMYLGLWNTTRWWSECKMED